MTDILRSSGGEVIIIEDPDLRSPRAAPAAKKETFVIENFTSGSVPDRIEFKLQERFRDRAIKELLAQSVMSESIQMVERDNAGYINVGIPEPNPGENEIVVEESFYTAATMKHKRFKASVFKDIIDTEFKEFV
jgi:hypothetical protein